MSIKNAHEKTHVQLIRIERGPLFPLVGAMGIISRLSLGVNLLELWVSFDSYFF